MQLFISVHLKIWVQMCVLSVLMPAAENVNEGCSRSSVFLNEPLERLLPWQETQKNTHTFDSAAIESMSKHLNIKCRPASTCTRTHRHYSICITHSHNRHTTVLLMQDTQAMHDGKRQSLMPWLLMQSETRQMESPRFNNEMKYYVIIVKNVCLCSFLFKCIMWLWED